MFKAFREAKEPRRAHNDARSLNFFILVLLIFICLCISGRLILSPTKSLLNSSSAEIHKPLEECEYLFGILTITSNRDLRMWARDHWISQLPDIACHIFLFDTDADVPFDEKIDALVLGSKYKGRAIRFGEKLYSYFSKALRRFPNVKYFIKMDDDAVICTKKLFRYFEVHPPDLRSYLGWFHKLHGTEDRSHEDLKSIGCNRLENSCSQLGQKRYATQITRSDEFFVLLGRQIVQELTSKPYCDIDSVDWCETHGQLYDTNFGGTSLGIWVSLLENVHARVMNHLIQFDMETSSKTGSGMIVYHPRKTIEDSSASWNLCESQIIESDNQHSSFRCNLGSCTNYINTLDFLIS